MQTEQVLIGTGADTLEGVLWLPEDYIGVILFAAGSGGNRLRPPNDYVASVLRGARLGTLWIDLLTAQDKQRRDPVSDLALLVQRLEAACDWLRQHEATRELPIGLFGANIGATAVMQVAAGQGRGIAAIVLRSGRPDLTGQGTLGRISVPTLLIVGGLDDGVIAPNRSAYAALRCQKRFEIIPGATHAFDEPGSMEVVARLARGWFLRHSSTVGRHFQDLR